MPKERISSNVENRGRMNLSGITGKFGAISAALALSLSLSSCSHEKSETETSPVETTEAAPIEPNMFNPETMEINVDNLKMETEQDPKRMAEVYMNRHQAWNMAGADETLHDEALKRAGNNTSSETSDWEIGIARSEEMEPIFAEALAGEKWKEDSSLAKWVEERRHQNSFNLGAYTVTYEKENPEWIYNQVDEINGEITREDNKDGTYTLTIPMHSYNEYEDREGLGINDSVIPRYDYNTDAYTTFKDLEDGTTVVVGEEYSDRY